ncbi:uncharacterized protein PHACADRAFT_251384, partial [Phanerochaete carnosa HHB-10118-sp]
MADEIRIVWKKPATASAILLGSVRWCMLLTVIVELAPPTPNGCKPLGILTDTLNLIGFVQTGLFAALRVFAICNRSYVWSLPMFALNLVPFAINLMYYTTSKYGYTVEPFVGLTCAVESSFSARTFNILVYVSRCSLILADTIVLVLTWIRTFGYWRQTRRANVRASLTTCLLRDGQALLAINVSQLLTIDSSAGVVPLTAFVVILPPVLINRFMINLRAVDSDALEPSYGSDEQRGLSTLQFRRPANFLGNIGESLQDGWSDSYQGNNLVEEDEVDPREDSTESIRKK